MSTTKRLADEAMRGSSKETSIQESSFTFPESVSNSGHATVTIDKPIQQNIVFMLVKKKQKRLTLDGICHNVMNPKTSKYETIRLIRGAPSIWSSELTE